MFPQRPGGRVAPWYESGVIVRRESAARPSSLPLPARTRWTTPGLSLRPRLRVASDELLHTTLI